MPALDIALLLVVLQVIIASPGLAALINGVFSKRKSGAEAGKEDASSASIMVKTATELANDLGKRLTETNIIVSDLEKKVDVLETQRDSLQDQVVERDKHIAKLEAKVDLLIKLYGRDPFNGGGGQA